MKYLIIVPDGAGDDNIEELGGKTPLQVAKMPNANRLASKGIVGMVSNVPKGMVPGSDAANLSVMGYSPETYLTGRSPLEAASMGIEMDDNDVSFRVNFVTLEGNGEYEELIMKDHSAGDLKTEEAEVLVDALNKFFRDERKNIYRGTGYRQCLIVKDGSTDVKLTPPHDILGEKVGEHMPDGVESQLLTELMKKSREILEEHPLNIERQKKGVNPANSIWIWGEGKKPELPLFKEKYGIDGTVVSAVDLIKGIGILAGLDTVEVEGATGTAETNFKGKADAAIDAFKSGKDFVYIHIEGPDECSHQGDLKGKIGCIEDIDEKITGPVTSYLDSTGEDYKVLIVPDHRTPIKVRTHTMDPVPFVVYQKNSEKEEDKGRIFAEFVGEEGEYFDSGCKLADFFFKKK